MQNDVAAPDQMPVVVAVDGSRGCLATVDIGVAEAVRRRAPLLIVHVWPGRYTGSFRSYGPVSGTEDGERLLRVAARRAEQLAPHLDIGTELLEGSASAVLAQRSASARLFVIGHRDDVLTRPSWGSTAAYLAHHIACPLLVNRGAAPDRGPVVLAVSARPAAADTVACAFEEAQLRRTRLVALHVWGDPENRAAMHAAESASIVAVGRRQAEKRLADALADALAAYPEMPVEQVVLRDLDVAYTVERAARRGQILVVGMGPHGRLAELLYGSLGQSLTRHAPCPVLVVPPANQYGHRAPRPSPSAAAGEKSSY